MANFFSLEKEGHLGAICSYHEPVSNGQEQLLSDCERGMVLVVATVFDLQEAIVQSEEIGDSIDLGIFLKEKCDEQDSTLKFARKKFMTLAYSHFAKFKAVFKSLNTHKYLPATSRKYEEEVNLLLTSAASNTPNWPSDLGLQLLVTKFFIEENGNRKQKEWSWLLGVKDVAQTNAPEAAKAATGVKDSVKGSSSKASEIGSGQTNEAEKAKSATGRGDRVKGSSSAASEIDSGQKESCKAVSVVPVSFNQTPGFGLLHHLKDQKSGQSQKDPRKKRSPIRHPNSPVKLPIFPSYYVNQRLTNANHTQAANRKVLADDSREVSVRDQRSGDVNNPSPKGNLKEGNRKEDLKRKDTQDFVKLGGTPLESMLRNKAGANHYKNAFGKAVAGPRSTVAPEPMEEMMSAQKRARMMMPGTSGDTQQPGPSALAEPSELNPGSSELVLLSELNLGTSRAAKFKHVRFTFPEYESCVYSAKQSTTMDLESLESLLDIMITREAFSNYVNMRLTTSVTLFNSYALVKPEDSDTAVKPMKFTMDNLLVESNGNPQENRYSCQICAKVIGNDPWVAIAHVEKHMKIILCSRPFPNGKNCNEPFQSRRMFIIHLVGQHQRPELILGQQLLQRECDEKRILKNTGGSSSRDK